MPLGMLNIPDDPFFSIFSRLREERILVIKKDITPELADELVDAIMWLNDQDPNKDITLYIISSWGGNIEATRAIYYAMQYVDADVKTVGIGLLGPMASLLLAGGQDTKRLVLPDAKIYIYQPSFVFLHEQGLETGLKGSELFRMWIWFGETLAHRTDKCSSEIFHDMREDCLMSAEEARAYGIFDRIAQG